MIHLLATVLSTRARCGVEIPATAVPSQMPARIDNRMDPLRYCVRCFETYVQERTTRRASGTVIEGGFPFEVGAAC